LRRLPLLLMDHAEHEMLISFGSEIKMLENGKIGGYAVLFSGPTDTDLYGDFFTDGTDFGDVKSVGLYYQHGYDPVLKNTRIGSGTLKYDERGLWFEAQIEDRHEYVDMIRELVEMGKLGYSSGAVSHLVSRKEAPNGAGQITAWPLGEVSLVTRPAEPRISVMPIKAYLKEIRNMKSESLNAYIDRVYQAFRAFAYDKGWIAEVYSDHVIAEYDGSYYRIAYAITDGEIKFAPMNGWVKVEKRVEWEEKKGAYFKRLEHIASGGAKPETDPAEAAEKAAPTVVQAKPDADGAGISPEPQHDNQTTQEAKKMADEKTTPDAEAKGTTIDIEAILARQEERFNERLEKIQKSFSESQTVTGVAEVKGAPGIIEHRGDNFPQALRRWVRTGDSGGLKGFTGVDEQSGRETLEIKASNATDMNIGTAADGGNTVTDAMWNQIQTRSDEKSLAAKVGVKKYTYTGTTLDISTDTEADGEFVATNEAAQFDEDAPAIGQVSLTKVKYTKRTLISYELMQDTSAVNLMEHIMDAVAFGKAKTDNDLLITAVETDGTEYKVFAGTAAIAVGELEEIAINNTNAWYVDNPEDASWIMTAATHAAIANLGSTSIRRYETNPQGSGRTLLGSSIHYSNKAEAIGSGNKPVLYGNFRYVAQGEDPGLTFLRDPYTRGDYGQVRLLWYYRTAFKVMIPAAVGYGRNTTT